MQIIKIKVKGFLDSLTLYASSKKIRYERENRKTEY
jgi:hypothetical protein